MKFNFTFNLAAESAKITGDSFSGELGKMDCPIELAIELDASEATQGIGLIKEAIKGIPGLLKQQAEDSEKLEKLRADNAENLEKLRAGNAESLERLKARLTGEALEKQKAADECAIERIRLQSTSTSKATKN